MHYIMSTVSRCDHTLVRGLKRFRHRHKLPDPSLKGLDLVVGIWNIGECHWVAYCIDQTHQSIMYHDSYGTEPAPAEVTKLQALAETFFGAEGSTYTIAHIECPTQFDTTSCGYFALYYLFIMVMRYHHEMSVVFYAPHPTHPGNVGARTHITNRLYNMLRGKPVLAPRRSDRV